MGGRKGKRNRKGREIDVNNREWSTKSDRNKDQIVIQAGKRRSESRGVAACFYS